MGQNHPQMKQDRRLILPHRTPFFYGWIIVAGAFLGNLVGGGLESFTFSVFLRPMSESLGWTRTALTGALTVRLATSAALQPLFGPLVDRYGPRYIMVASAIIGGVAALLLSRVNEIWQFYAIFALVGLSGGVGVGGVVTRATVAKWFIRLRGRAMAFTTMGGAAPGVVLAPLLTFVVFNHGWQSGWLVMAALFFSLLLPISFLMIRQPEDVGLLPDGAKNQEEVQAAHRRRSGQEFESSWRLGEALQTKALWFLTISLVVGGFSVASVVVHEFSYVTDQGFSTGVAAAVLSTHAVMASTGRLIWGFLVERFHVRYCMAILYLCCALGVGTLLVASSVPMVFLFAVVYGVSVGGHAVLSSVVWADYFGREFVGTIRGALTPLTTGSIAIGPLLVGLGYDIAGSYLEVFLGLLALYLLGSVLILLAKPPVKPEVATSEPAV